jgi:hypothetical protein
VITRTMFDVKSIKESAIVARRAREPDRMAAVS